MHVPHSLSAVASTKEYPLSSSSRMIRLASCPMRDLMPGFKPVTCGWFYPVNDSKVPLRCDARVLVLVHCLLSFIHCFKFSRPLLMEFGIQFLLSCLALTVFGIWYQDSGLWNIGK